jgi:two-component sensor histidine kinase
MFSAMSTTHPSSRDPYPKAEQISKPQSQHTDLDQRLQQLELELQQEKVAHEQTKATLQNMKEWLQLASDAEEMAIWSQDILAGVEILSDKGYELYGIDPSAFKRQTEPFSAWIYPIKNLYNWIHPDDEEFVRQAEEEAFRSGKFKAEFRIVCPDGTVRWFIGIGRVAYDKSGRPITMYGVDLNITERKQIEEQLKASLQEKEILLKEVHHRVKNNLQVISSLLSLQSYTIQDPQVQVLFQNTRNRVHSMALLHEQLYQSDNLAQIDFAHYVQRLVRHIVDSHDAPTRNITFTIDIAQVNLRMDTVLPCGLIINELVTNALKHAFPDGCGGEIGIRFVATDPGQCGLTIWDTGVGLPEGLELNRRTSSLGLRLVNALVRQLQGSLEVTPQPGSTFTIAFAHKG